MWNINMMDEMGKQWEKMMKQWFDELMNNPEFLQNVGKTMETALTSKILADDMKNNIAKSMAMPTASLVARLGTHIMRQESKIAELEEHILELKDDIKNILNAVEKNQNSKQKKVETPEKAKKSDKKVKSAKKGVK